MHEAAARMPSLLAAAAMVGLAVWLLWLNPRHRAYRVFALLLVMRGLSFIDGYNWASHSSDGVRAFASFDAILEIALPFVALGFLLVYPRTQGFRGRRALQWVVWTGLAVAGFVYVLDPSLYGQIVPREDGSPRFAVAGPLYILANVQTPIYSLIGFVCAIAYVRSRDETVRPSLLLVSAGFALQRVYGSSHSVWVRVVGTQEWFTTLWLVISFSVLFVLATAFVMIRHRIRGPQEDRRAVNLYLAGMAFALATYIGARMGDEAFGALGGGFTTFSFADGLWRIALPILVTYGLLRHRMFDIDLRVRWTLKQGTVAAIFVAVFFAVSELAQSMFANWSGSALLGVGAAGLLVFAVHPLQRAAESFTSRVMPGVENSEAWKSGRRSDVYLTAVRYALQDRVLSRDEERHLADLATELGITASVALRMREEIEREIGLPAS